jgi:1-aminocyclopropane-1-carboxylate deaminase
LDAVYTGKMMLGILDLITKDYFPKGSSILAIHTGGLQGNKGMSKRLGVILPIS